jgi:hypothetical protein
LKRYDPQQLNITIDDIIHSYKKTNIISKTKFRHKEENIQLFDVEGMMLTRKERLEKIFEKAKVNAVVYVISLTEYQFWNNFESCENKFQNSIDAFENAMGMKQLENVPWILLFNKFDLFEEKVKAFPLENYFDDYQKDKQKSDVEFVVGKYLEKVKFKVEKEIVSIFQQNDVIKIINKMETKLF